MIARCCAVLLALVTLAPAQVPPPAQSSKPATANPAEHPVSTPAQNELLWRKLERTVQQINAELDGTMGVAIMDLTDGRTMVMNGDAVFTQASSIKVAVLVTLYAQDQQSKSAGARLADLYTVDKKDLVADSYIMGGLTPGVTRVTNRDLASFTAAVSDNSAANVLIDRVGMQNVNALLESLGLHKTRLQRKMMDVQAAQQGRENLSTPNEMMTLFADLYQGKVLDKQHTDDFFRVLGVHKESNMPRYLPEDIVVANKPGELAAVRNDVGIVFAPNRPFVLCVMTAYLKRERDGADAIARIAEAAYDYFDRVGRSSEYGRIISERNSR